MPVKRAAATTPKKRAAVKKETPLPIPLTCGGPFVNAEGRCSHGLENGSCDLPDQFMCPIYLRFEIDNPTKVGDVPEDLVQKFRSIKPVPL